MNYLKILKEEELKHETVRYCFCRACHSSKDCYGECKYFQKYVQQSDVKTRYEMFINQMRLQEMA